MISPVAWGVGSVLAPNAATRRFQLLLIKPSHYDDDGYVIQWVRSMIPTNSLACVNALAHDAARRAVLGSDVAIDITPIDECHTRVRCQDIIKRFRQHGNFGLVGLVGVQSNQFPRAIDIARPLRAAGIQVAIGGFHVSGCLAMLPELPADLQGALGMGCSLFAGEAEEGRLDLVLRDAAEGRLQPVYNFMKELPALEDSPSPILPPETLKRTINYFGSFDAGRGCPYQCSFCTIINVQGRKSRRRSPDDIERTVQEHARYGFRWFFVTDDNFARNKDWELIFDRLIDMRENRGFDIRLIIQVDTLCHKIPGFIDKAARAGVRKVFIGLENINPANLLAAKKRQNKITEYRRMLLAWKHARVITYAGYILGFPADTAQSIREDIEIIKKELPLDILEFFCLTPLPGSEDHQTLWKKGAWMDPDMNKYDLEHVVAGHARMTSEEWSRIYREAWDLYYTPEHIETVLRRAAACNLGVSHLAALMWSFSRCVSFENVHPLQSGLFRRKYRLDRRHGVAPEPVWRFYPKLAWDILSKHARMLRHFLAISATLRRVRNDPQRYAYMDQALADTCDDEPDTLQLFTHNEDARDTVAHERKVAALTHGGRATIQAGAHADAPLG
jgi:radical SAM family protein